MNASSTGVSGRCLAARSALNDSRSRQPRARVISPAIRYNSGGLDKRPRTVVAAGGMAHEETAS